MISSTFLWLTIAMLTYKNSFTRMTPEVKSLTKCLERRRKASSEISLLFALTLDARCYTCLFVNITIVIISSKTIEDIYFYD